MNAVLEMNSEGVNSIHEVPLNTWHNYHGNDSDVIIVMKYSAKTLLLCAAHVGGKIASWLNKSCS